MVLVKMSCDCGKKPVTLSYNPVKFGVHRQGLIQAVFDIQTVYIGILILGTLIWAWPNLILGKTESIIQRNSRFS